MRALTCQLLIINENVRHSRWCLNLTLVFAVWRSTIRDNTYTDCRPHSDELKDVDIQYS